MPTVREGALKGAVLEHFQEKWNPVFRPKMRQCKNARAVSLSGLCEIALGALVLLGASLLVALVHWLLI